MAVYTILAALLMIFAHASVPLIPFSSFTAHASTSDGAIRSDFNGDGYDDLAIGVPQIGNIEGGGVNVLYGSPDGITSANDQYWTQDSPGIEESSESGDQFGATLAPGDFNGDGYYDLAIGVHDEAIGTMTTGAVSIIYGSSAGLRANQASDGSGRADQFWTQDSPGIEDEAEPDDGFGAVLASGDFNGDGKDDLAVTNLREEIAGMEFAGAVNVLYGSDTGLTDAGDQFWHQNSPGIEDSAESEDGFGRSLIAGDFNGDGRDDLAIGVPLEDLGTSPSINQCGAVHILYGTSLGLSSSGDQFWSQNSPGIEDRIEFNDNFGWSLTTGDFDNDGREDLAIGAPKVGLDAGEVNVIYGTDNGLSSADDQVWTQNSAGIEDAEEDNDSFGYSVAAGDFNGDGFDDLAVGVENEGVGSIEKAGAVNVLLGSASGITSSNDQFWHQNISGIDDSAEAGDGFGGSVATGDFDNDGRADLVVGVQSEDVGSIAEAGAVNVIYGTASGLSAAGDQLWHQNRPGVNDTAEIADHFGWSIG